MPSVAAVITDMGVCPFSVDASRAGLPIGQVRYPVTRETTAESIYREYWREVGGTECGVSSFFLYVEGRTTMPEE